MRLIAAALAVLVFGLVSIISIPGSTTRAQPVELDGKTIFRFDTFGDEQLWTDVLRMHEVILNVSPETALGTLGLKVDGDALPPAVKNALQAGQVNLKDPAVTLQLLQLNAVVGVIGTFSGPRLKSFGITCALCHSTVDNSLAPGIGKRLDGWPNRDLDAGKLLAESPAFPQALKDEFSAWGRGKDDPRHHIFDGTNIIPLNDPSLPVVIPPAFGLQGVNFEIFTGDGPISYWNAYVAISQMGGKGAFNDDRIGVAITQKQDLVTPKLPALLEYQLSLKAPPPPAGSFETQAAQRGEKVFNGAGRCASCHVRPLLTDVNNAPDSSMPLLHDPDEVGQDRAYAQRSATKLYRTTPLRALWQHPPYFHDGSAADLRAVVEHYNRVLELDLTERQKLDLVEYLKSI
jgi:hypothetical protein